MLTLNTLIDIIGWIGAALLLMAYALVSFRRLPGDSVRFQLLNLMGGVLLAANSGYHGALPSVVVNLVWIVIGTGALMRARRNRAAQSTETLPSTNL